jgi:hypothetical protein
MAKSWVPYAINYNALPIDVLNMHRKCPGKSILSPYYTITQRWIYKPHPALHTSIQYDQWFDNNNAPKTGI